MHDDDCATRDICEQNGPRYIAMLRRAAELVDADKVLFVAHPRALQDLADARIEIRDGKVVVS